jgi:O-antigen/teichoic acid export membrane protein
VSTRAQAMRNTLFSSVGIYTEYLLGVLVSIIIARHLGPADFGAYSLVVWLTAIGITTTNSGTTTAVIKFVAELRGSERDDLLPALVAYLRRAQHGFLVAVLAVAALVLWFAGDRIAPELDRRVLFALLVLTIGLRAPYMFNISIAKGFERFSATATIALVATPLNLGMVLVAWALNAPVEGFLGVFAISSVVFYLLSRYQAAKLVAPAHAPLPDELLRRVRRHMRIVAATVTLNFFAASETEVLFLNLFDQAAGAGQFKVAFQLASGAALLVPGVFSAVLLPMMSKALSQGKAVAARRFVASTTYLTLLAAPLIGFGFVFGDATIHVLYGNAYEAAGPVLAGCLFAASILTITQAAASLLLSADHQLSILLRTIVCGLLKVLLDVILIRKYGLHGALGAYVIVAMITTSTTVILALRVSGGSLAWGRLGRMLAALLIAVALSFPLRNLGSPLAAMLGGGALLAIVYVALTIAFGCWSRGDIDYIKTLHRRFASDKPGRVSRLLDWAGDRSAKDYL